MKIAVIGAGAMGSLFGALIAEAGNDVWLLDIWEEHINAIKEKGLTIESAEQTRSVLVNATTNPNQIGAADLILIFVKSMHTQKAADTSRALVGKETVVLTLQNGMGNADILVETIKSAPVLAGTTSHGATLLGPGKIRHAGRGPTIIGMWSDTESSLAKRIAAAFNNAKIDTEVAENIRDVVWGKLLINVGINAITALTGIKNGQILDLEITKALSRAAVEEAMAVARAQGIHVRDDAPEHVFQVAQATVLNRSSMGQDVDNKRSTEIEAINGVVVREGRRLGGHYAGQPNPGRIGGNAARTLPIGGS
jgi:2-dehydropantoate 2-reductase